MEKKNVILLTVIAVATLLITVVGATFAYFAAKIEGNEDAQTVTITAANDLTITYDGGEKITATNIIPGYGVTYGMEDATRTKTITVTNSGKYDLEYTINWSAVTNDIADSGNLKYDVTTSAEWDSSSSHVGSSTSDVASMTKTDQVFPATGNTDAFTTQQIQAGEKITYVISLKYVDTGIEQGNPEASQSFIATLDIPKNGVKVLKLATAE